MFVFIKMIFCVDESMFGKRKVSNHTLSHFKKYFLLLTVALVVNTKQVVLA